jgi:hypothetical protein
VGKEIKVWNIIKKAFFFITSFIAGLFVIEQIKNIGKVKYQVDWLPTKQKDVVKINKKKKRKLPIDPKTGHQYTSDEIKAIGLPDESDMLELRVEPKHESTNRKINNTSNNPDLDL